MFEGKNEYCFLGLWGSGNLIYWITEVGKVTAAAQIERNANEQDRPGSGQLFASRSSSLRFLEQLATGVTAYFQVNPRTPTTPNDKSFFYAQITKSELLKMLDVAGQAARGAEVRLVFRINDRESHFLPTNDQGKIDQLKQCAAKL